ncbi:hypothetical protein H6F75_00350 [Nodosilinea sp. FACHB-131]|uniref:hypothetical protein n=1 Tax=Cyanophyceae TaxID=3028117 RepID=UPI0016835192|nr:hypothetical protein [Nodosilinea sp. FACHB-131]MBD1871920.1 hypothetical protein [Nodosilinea sp. FACHB-131]
MSRKIAAPPTCHPDRPYHAKGLCSKCYKSQWGKGKRRAPSPTNATCHPDRPHYAKGLCSQCYDAQWAKAKGKAPRDRYRAKLRLLCQVAGTNPRRTTLADLLSNQEHLRQLNVAHKAGDPKMAQAWPMLSIPQKSAINYGKVL